MVVFRVSVFLAITLYLTACFSATAIVSEDDANRAVRDTQEYVMQVYNNAYNDFTTVRVLLTHAREYNREAEHAAYEGEKTAKGNSEAQAISKEAKEVFEKVIKKYPSAYAVMDKALKVTKQFLSKATTLKTRSESAIHIAAGEDLDYARRKATAENMKSEAEKLKQEIDKSFVSLDDAFSTHKDMQVSDKSPKVAMHLTNAIVAVAKIETLLKSAGTYIQHMQQKTDEINVNFKAMKKLKESSPSNVSEYVSSLCYYSENDFTSASRKLKEALKVKKCMLQKHKEAVTTLAKLNIEADVEDIDNVAISATRISNGVAEKLPNLKKALKAITIYAEYIKFNVISARKMMARKFKNVDDSLDNDKVNPSDTDKPHRFVKAATGNPSKSGEKQPSKTNKEARKNGTPDGSTNKDSSHLTNEKTIPASGVSSDSAMTVSVYIPLALIACAALHW